MGRRTTSVNVRGRRNPMDRRTRWIAGGMLGLAAIAGGAGWAFASAADDDEPLSGSVLDQATAAAIEHTGGGTVVETEAGDDGAAYGVEVRLDDGRIVEVALDANFQVIGEEADDDGPPDEDGAGEH
jgi:hypothetical protein